MSLEAHRDPSFLLLFHKIHSGAVSIEKEKYLTTAHSLKTSRSSLNFPNSVDTRHTVMPIRTLFSEIFHSRIVFLLRWSIPRLLRSLGHSSFSKRHTEKVFFANSKVRAPWRVLDVSVGSIRVEASHDWYQLSK